MSGFTYNGVHSSTYNVEYIPDASARWWDSADFEIYKTEVGWHNGGYIYGNAAKIRVIELSCFFEEITIAQKESIRRWLGRNTKGNLTIDDRPFVYYKVRPGGIVPGKIYNDNGKYSGTFTVKFVAENPFGYLNRKFNTANDHDNASDYCNIRAEANMPAAPGTASTSFSVYNPGTEPCGLTIQLSGSTSKPISFYNSTNKTRCAISSLPSNNLVLKIDGDTGMVTVINGTASSNGFAYHDFGIVRLEPGSNSITIQEKNNSGNWASRSTLNLTSISIDYNPRLL